MPEPELSYKTHRKFVPWYHFVATGILILCLLWNLYRLVTDFSPDRIFDVLLTVGIIIVGGYTRLFPLGVQDRLIHLEQSHRLAALLPADQAESVAKLRKRHMIALRFASDEEMPELVRRILAGELDGTEEIKKQIKTWIPDRMRI